MTDKKIKKQLELKRLSNDVCPKCGAKNTKESNFCKGCGIDLNAKNEELMGEIDKENEEKTEEAIRMQNNNLGKDNPKNFFIKNKVIIGISIFVLLIIAVGAYLYEINQPLTPEQYQIQRNSWYSQLDDFQGQDGEIEREIIDSEISTPDAANELLELSDKATDLVNTINNTKPPAGYEAVHQLDLEAASAEAEALHLEGESDMTNNPTYTQSIVNNKTVCTNDMQQSNELINQMGGT